MIEFKSVCASYTAETPILKDVSFSIGRGEFVSFVGTNGAGKSTTMRLCNGLLKPTSGEVLVEGLSTTALKTSQIARKIGFLFQNPDRQICNSTVRDELLFGFKAVGSMSEEAQARVDAVIEEFELNGDADPFLLNRGTRQLLALASVVVMETPVLLLDEPTTGLDHRECVKVMEFIKRLHREKGITVVMVCHDMEVVADYAERVIVMTKGGVVADGPTFEILRNAEICKAADLVPPQIVDISMELVRRHPELGETLVGKANTLSELSSALKALVTDRKGL